jgi:hypothetical protein
MTYTISGYGITGTIAGRSIWRDHNDRRYYLLLALDDRLYDVSEVLLREYVG